MTPNNDAAEQLVQDLATFTAVTAEMTTCWRRANAAHLIEAEKNRDYSDGVIRGMWWALLIVVLLGPGSDLDKGRRLLQVEQRIPQQLRLLTDEDDELSAFPEDVPEALAIEVCQRGIDYLREATSTTGEWWDLCKRLLALPETTDLSSSICPN